MENVKSESDALRACYETFIKRSQEEYGLMIHHVEATPRKMSCMCVESKQGGNKLVPVLDIYFRDVSFQKVVDERGQLTDEISEKLRKLWQETTIPYGMFLNRKDYCDSRMYINAFHFEQRCFYDYATNRKNEIIDLLNARTGAKPEKLYPSPEGINIVYPTSDYMALGIEAKAEELRNEIIALARDYIYDKYQDKVTITSYVRFLHPQMPGYNGYWLWL